MAVAGRALVVTALALVASAAILVSGPPPAFGARVEDKPPPVIGSSYAAARDTLIAWWPSVRIDIEPAGYPTGADPALLTVDTEELRNPGWSDGPPDALPDPIVALTLSTAVPDLTGLSLDAATKVLTQHGLGIRPDPLEATGDWLVLRQRPLPGFQARMTGRLSSVVVGLEPTVRVPDVTGLTEDQARTAVEAAGLVYTLDLAGAGDPPGRAVGQGPAAGTPVRPGSPVRVRVERVAAPGPSNDPDVLQSVAWRTAGLGVLSALLLVLLILVALLAGRALRRSSPRGEVRTTVHTPPPDIRIEQLTDGPVWRISLEPRVDPGEQMLEEVGT